MWERSRPDKPGIIVRFTLCLEITESFCIFGKIFKIFFSQTDDSYNYKNITNGNLLLLNHEKCNLLFISNTRTFYI